MKFVTQDYYEILSVSPGATNEEVKRAYRLVRQSFRPDSMAIHSLYAPEETEAISAKIDEAFRILSDPELARRYAKYHRSARPGARVPRDPDVFFDQVHDLDGPSPIEQLARQVGRLSEVRRRVDRVAEEPVSVELRSIPPEPRFNPSPVSHTALPSVQVEPRPVVLGDAMEVDTDPAHPAVPAAVVPAPPDTLFDEPIVARASLLIDEGDDADIEPLSVLAAVSIDDDDELLSFEADDEVEEALASFEEGEGQISFDDDDVTPPSVESLPSSAFLTPMEPRYEAPAPQRQAALPLLPARPAAEPMRPAARAPMDPSTLPLPGSQVEPSASVTPFARVETAVSVPPVRPVVAPAASVPLGVTSPSTPAVAAMSAPTTPSLAPVAKAQPTVEPPGEDEGVSAGALALARRASSPRRWDRASIRTRAVGPLDVLSREVLDSIEMDSGGMNGAFLQKARRELGVAIKDISGRTKISVMMLRYIEADEVSELPAKVYLKGYLTQVARLLKLPAQEFVTKYLDVNGIP